MDNTTQSFTNNANYVSIVSLVLLGLSHYGIIISQNEAVEVVVGVVALISVIRQVFVHKGLVKVANKAGANIKG